MSAEYSKRNGSNQSNKNSNSNNKLPAFTIDASDISVAVSMDDTMELDRIGDTLIGRIRTAILSVAAARTPQRPSSVMSATLSVTDALTDHLPRMSLSSGLFSTLHEHFHVRIKYKSDYIYAQSVPEDFRLQVIERWLRQTDLPAVHLELSEVLLDAAFHPVLIN